MSLDLNHAAILESNPKSRVWVFRGPSALGQPMPCIGIDIDAQVERVVADIVALGCETVEFLGTKNHWTDELVE